MNIISRITYLTDKLTKDNYDEANGVSVSVYSYTIKLKNDVELWRPVISCKERAILPYSVNPKELENSTIRETVYSPSDNPDMVGSGAEHGQRVVLEKAHGGYWVVIYDSEVN